ncbi:MAG TPA: DUF4402 domain-containing protein [Cellvibrionaceae bacterium]
MNKSIIIIILCVFSANARADLSIDSPLSFGEITVRNNNSVSSTTITRAGAQSSTGQILVIKPGTPGVYTLSGLPAYTNVNLSLDIPVSSSMSYADTAQFTITAIDLADTVRTDGNGTVQFRMGGTLSTSGNPAENYFSGAEYIIFMNIDMAY